VSDAAGPAAPEPGAQVSPQWAAWRRSIDLTEYESRFVGEASHGEADFVESLGRRSVLDAGCGAGRLGVELDRRGLDVAGVDLDDDMIALARRHAPHLAWTVADLAAFDLGRSFEVVAMAGNVMLYCRADDRASVVATCARHLADGGLLVAGFGLRGAPGDLTLDDYDRFAAAAGLELVERWSTWDRQPFTAGGNYAVSVHRRVGDVNSSPA
jgi:SAM-dependent methyltransferase